MKNYAVTLGLIAIVFLCRVLGQVIVTTFSPSFLPPMEEWYSGVIPYPVLLSVQIAILVFQAVVSRQLWIGSGPLTLPRPSLGAGLKWFSLVYFLAMVTRYVISMILYPERRWFGQTIPIVFHFVLALYIYVLSRHFRSLRLLRSPPG